MSEKKLNEELSDTSLQETDNVLKTPDEVLEEIISSEMPIEELEQQLQPREVINAIRSEFRSEFRGPLPPPTILKQYDEIETGLANRIVCMAEKEQEHRHDRVNKCIKADSRDSLLGIVSAFLICVSMIYVGREIVLGVPHISGLLSGSVISMAGFGGVIGVFIRGTNPTWKNNDANKEPQEPQEPQDPYDGANG